MIDASIPLRAFAGQPDSGDFYSKLIQARQLAQRRKLEDLQIQQEQMKLSELARQQSEAAGVRQAAAGAVTPAQTQQVNIPGVSLGQYGEVGGHSDSLTSPPQFDRSKMLSNLAANPQTAAQVPQFQSQFAQQDAELEKQLLAIKTAQVKLSGEQSDALVKHADLAGRFAMPVADAEKQGLPPQQIEPIYQQARQAAAQNGVDVSTLPQNYVPGIGQRTVAQSMSVKDAVAANNQATTAAETARHNKASESNQLSAQATTRRGQDMTDARSREQNQIARETKLEMNKAGDENGLVSFNASMDRLASAAKELKDHPGLGGITGKMGLIPNIPGGEAANAKAKLGTLKSQVAFTTLQEMRNNSKTGGALGQVSDKEGQLLESNIASLETAQSKEEYQKSLQKIIDQAEGAKTRARDAINNKYNRTISPQQFGPQPGTVENGYRFKGGNPADPSSWEKANN